MYPVSNKPVSNPAAHWRELKALPVAAVVFFGREFARCELINEMQRKR